MKLNKSKSVKLRHSIPSPETTTRPAKKTKAKQGAGQQKKKHEKKKTPLMSRVTKRNTCPGGVRPSVTLEKSRRSKIGGGGIDAKGSPNCIVEHIFRTCLRILLPRINRRLLRRSYQGSFMAAGWQWQPSGAAARARSPRA